MREIKGIIVGERGPPGSNGWDGAGAEPDRRAPRRHDSLLSDAAIKLFKLDAELLATRVCGPAGLLVYRFC